MSSAMRFAITDALDDLARRAQAATAMPMAEREDYLRLLSSLFRMHALLEQATELTSQAIEAGAGEAPRDLVLSPLTVDGTSLPAN